MFIQCKPSSSIPFWQRMGFTLIKNSKWGRNYAYRILEKPLPLPDTGVGIKVFIWFFPEKRNWLSETKPLAVHSPNARLASNNTIHLAERVSFHEEAHPDIGDVVVEIQVDGRQRYCDKAKYEGAQQIGVRRCIHGFYIDRISPIWTTMGK